MGFKIKGKDLQDYAEIENYNAISNKTSNFFYSDKVSIKGLSKTGSMIANAPSGYNWSSNYLPTSVKLNGSQTNASYRGCRPKYTQRISLGHGNYSIAVISNGSYYKLVLKNGNTSTTIKDLGKNTTGFCYVLVQSAGGSGAENRTGIGGTAGGGGGSGACVFMLVKATLSNPIDLIVGPECRIGNTNQCHCLVRKGGNASGASGGSAGNYAMVNSSYTKYIWLNDYSNGASGGNKGSSGNTPVYVASSDSTPNTIRFNGYSGGSGSGGGGGGAGSNLSSGGNAGGGSGANGSYGSGGGGASYHFFNKYYGGSGGSSNAKIYY